VALGGQNNEPTGIIAFVGSTAIAWPLSAHAQQPAVPVIGLLGSATATGWAPYVSAFRQGLRDAGYVEGIRKGLVATGQVDG